MRILITGVTGLVGSAIVKQCHEQGIKVNYLTTSSKKIKDTDNYKGFLWHPLKKEIDKACLQNVSAIIHLAGASIAKKWTTAYKDNIIASRVNVTQFLVSVLQSNAHSVTQVISASAIGIYPDSLTACYTEDEEHVSESFLGEVVKKWETAVNEFKVLDVNVAKVRVGVVLSKKGGALPQMVKPIKFGVGAAFGSGKQWQSWIHIQDIAGIFLYILNNNLKGVYNGVAPLPETNETLTKTIAKQLKRPLFLPNSPRFVMQFVLGEMSALLFESQKVSALKIQEAGYVFKFQNLELALKNVLDTSK